MPPPPSRASSSDAFGDSPGGGQLTALGRPRPSLLDPTAPLPPLLAPPAASLDGEQRSLLASIVEKRRRLEELKKEIVEEAAALSKMERLLHCRVAHVETLGSMLRRNAFRLATILGDFCGAAAIGTLACVALEHKEGVYNSGASLDLTSVWRRRFSFADALALTQRGFHVTGMRLALSTVTLPSDAAMAPIVRCLKVLDMSSCRDLQLGE